MYARWRDRERYGKFGNCNATLELQFKMGAVCEHMFGKGSFHTHTITSDQTTQQADMNKNTKSKIKICNRKLIPNPITKMNAATSRA